MARVALLSDPHVNRDTNGMNATFKPHFEKTIADVNAANVNLVLIAGDLTQSGKPEEMDDFKAHLKKIKAPVYYVPGNHDVGHKFNSGKNEGTVTAERVEAYEKKLGPSFFVKKKSGIRIIGLNSSILGSGFESEEKMWNLFQKEMSKRPVPTIVFQHYPLFTKNVSEAGGVYFNVEPEPRHRLLNQLKQGGVKIFLSGHLHHEQKYEQDGILLFSTAPISFGLPKGKQPEGWTLVTIFKDGNAKTEFQIIGPD